jgi:hypothetical protein
MRFFNIPVIGGVADFQVTFKHTPYKNPYGKINKNRKTECIISVILPERAIMVENHNLKRFANHTEKGDVKLYKMDGWDCPGIVIPIAYGIARTGSGDMFCRATGRKVAMGKAISALTRYQERDDRGVLPGKLPDFDISDVTARALFHALAANGK